MTQEAGVAPQAVPPKLLFPILQGASVEENEDLHTMWAALLANAASPDSAEKVRPGFIAILRQMESDEAGLLKWMCTYDEEHLHARGDMISLAIGFERMTGLPTNIDSPQFNICLSRLEAEGLIELDEHCYYSTNLATAFIAACGPPKPKS
jgi:hypothetical protein